MINVNDYMLDGADYQARAVLAFLQSNDNLIEDSWNTERGKYEANINIGRWENCREQGYVLSMMSQNRRQINIAFFEHRNSDSICAVVWEQYSVNSITIDTANFGDGIYKDKYDVSHSSGYGDIVGMSDFIIVTLTNFWNKNKCYTRIN